VPTTTFRAAILDFDGLILETEGPGFESWRALFREHGADYTLAECQELVGTPETAHALFEARCGRPADWAVLERRRKELEDRIHEGLSLQPGVEALLRQARALGLGLAVASSSPHGWVERHLGVHGLSAAFDHLVCVEDAPRAKPAPDLYLEAVRRLGATPATAVAFEDSYNGALAARRAGLWCVAVPTPMTAGQDLSHADAVVPTLEGLDLEALLAGFEARGR
jgi:HAD superfamily hydrolase (TIGR01509 family)